MVFVDLEWNGKAMGTKSEAKAVKNADKTAARELPKDTAKIILVVLAVLMANV